MAWPRPDPILDESGRTACGTQEDGKNVDRIQNSMRNQGLARPREGAVLGGVCAGLGRRLGIGAWPARLLFVVGLMLIPGSQFLVYPLLWVFMPREETVVVA